MLGGRGRGKLLTRRNRYDFGLGNSVHLGTSDVEEVDQLVAVIVGGAVLLLLTMTVLLVLVVVVVVVVVVVIERHSR